MEAFKFVVCRVVQTLSDKIGLKVGAGQVSRAQCKHFGSSVLPFSFFLLSVCSDQ
jgi:hypothetical protein